MSKKQTIYYAARMEAARKTAFSPAVNALPT